MRALLLLPCAVLTLTLLGCGGPCADGSTETTTPGAGWVDLGVPTGATACISASMPDDPYVSFKEGSEAEGAKKLVDHMTSKGWKELPVPAAIQKVDAERAIGGYHGGTPKIFGKDGTAERRYGRVYKAPGGHVVLSLYKDACTPTSSGAVIDECQ